MNQPSQNSIASAVPHEVAQETLQNLDNYLLVLRNISIESGNSIEMFQYKKDFQLQFRQLIDGISTFTDAVGQIKKLFRIGILQPIDLLEADLLSILKDLLSSQQSGQTAYIQEILKIHLPKCLDDWRVEGIPVLIRSRDS